MPFGDGARELGAGSRSPSGHTVDGVWCRPQPGARSLRCLWGREHPPVLPRHRPRAPHGGSRPCCLCRAVSRISLRSARRLHVRYRPLSRTYRPQIVREMRGTFNDDSRRHRPSHDQDRAVLNVVKALATLRSTLRALALVDRLPAGERLIRRIHRTSFRVRGWAFESRTREMRPRVSVANLVSGEPGRTTNLNTAVDTAVEVDEAARYCDVRVPHTTPWFSFSTAASPRYRKRCTRFPS